MASGDARPLPLKNTAYRFYFAVRKNDGTLITTWTGADSEVSLDGAAFADATNEATEIGTSGIGYIDLTASEMNADAVVLKVTVTNTDALPLVFTFFPEESSDRTTLVGEVQSGLATAAALATVDDFIDTEVAAIKAKTDLIPADPATETTLATLATAANLATLTGYVDTEVAAIKAKTDLIPADPATETTLATLATQASVNTIDDFLDTEIAAIKAKTDNLPASPAATGDIPTANQVADAWLDRVDAIETGLTPRESMRLQSAAAAGKISGAATTTMAVRNVGDTKTRITATVDADGNRTAVTTDLT